MKAITVERYSGIDELQAHIVPSPEKPKGVKATSVNAIDIKVRKGVYDDTPDYYQKVAGLLRPYHCIGIDGAGIVFEISPNVKNFKPGDRVFHMSKPIQQGKNREHQIVNDLTVGHKPKTLDFMESTALLLTCETLVERMGIQKCENAGLLIINGAGGVGSVASQTARSVLELPVVIATASRPETIAFTKAMGATHVINHKKDLRPQIKELNLNVPIKYLCTTGNGLLDCAESCLVPRHRVRVQVFDVLLGMAWNEVVPRLGPTESAEYVRKSRSLGGRWEDQSHLKKWLRLTVSGLREAHRLIESSKTIRKIGLGWMKMDLESLLIRLK